jgi:glutaredoxin
MFSFFQRLCFLALGLLVMALAPACQDGQGGGKTGKPDDAAGQASAPEPPVVRDDSKGLLFTFVGPHGDFLSVDRADAVPKEARERVLVADLTKSAEARNAHRTVFFADLTKKSAQGTYTVIALSRYDATDLGDAEGAVVANTDAVIVYSAEWCGYCKKAMAWLGKNKVPFEKRDVEKDPGVGLELKKKLKAAGLQGGGIPVIDVKGTLVMGFDRPRLQALLFDDDKKGKTPGAEK